MTTCPGCSAALAEGTLDCPRCHTLVHRDLLAQLRARAVAATAPSEALAAWREAQDLLPPGSRQYSQVGERIQALSAQLDGAAPAPPPDAAAAQAKRRGWLGSGVLVGAGLLWKFKTVGLLLASKLKFLAMGFTKLPTLLSMFSAVGVYALLWGWKFALGFVLCIYVHEIGHVFALARYGIKASAPMFIPGFGAFVRLKQAPANNREDARVGIAGPVWGTGAALVCLAIGNAADSGLFMALARTAAWINLFNLVPVASLDGGRAFRAMSRSDRLVVAGATLTGGLMTHDPLSILIGLVALGVAAFRPGATERDGFTVLVYGLLGFGLPFLATIEVPGM